jgi:hypothetical protein
MYRTEYTPKEIEPCPTALLEYVVFYFTIIYVCKNKCRTPRNNNVLHHTEPSGHKFYQPQHEAVQSQ